MESADNDHSRDVQLKHLHRLQERVVRGLDNRERRRQEQERVASLLQDLAPLSHGLEAHEGTSPARPATVSEAASPSPLPGLTSAMRRVVSEHGRLAATESELAAGT